MIHALAVWMVARLDVRSARGATAVEYGILASAIAMVIVLAVSFLGGETKDGFVCAGRAYEMRSAQC